MEWIYVYINDMRDTYRGWNPDWLIIWDQMTKGIASALFIMA